MNGFDIRVEGRAGRLTFSRPNALNALSSTMSIAAEHALDHWRDDNDVELILIDAEGEKAFCAGGDIAELYSNGMKGQYSLGREFWRQEYRLNLKIADYPKPIVSMMQGYTMGGGVGVGCHASHRIIGETSKIAMPECGIGLMPDVGGTSLLGNAPDGIGVFYGLTGARMNPADAIYAGFADLFVPQTQWDALKSELIETGKVENIKDYATHAGVMQQTDVFKKLSDCFSGTTVAVIADALSKRTEEIALNVENALRRGSPLALACTLLAVREAGDLSLAEALGREYRFSHRAQEQGDILEGIRAQIIDKDYTPNWCHKFGQVPSVDIDKMRASLGALDWRV